MFDIKIEEVNYYIDRKCAGECPIVKAEVYVDKVHIKRTWEFDVLSYANRVSGVRPIELIIEELVKKMWTALHRPVSNEWYVRIDMYLPERADSFDMTYMNELFTKCLAHERFRDNYVRMLSNYDLSLEPDEKHCLMLENYIKTGKLEFVPNRDIKSMFPGKLLEHVERQIKFADPWINTSITKQEVEDMMNSETVKNFVKERKALQIEDVIFNDPATIVFWRDGSKTVVKAIDEPYDPEKGLAMAIVKKVYGNEGNYYNTIKHWLNKYESKVKANSLTALLDILIPKEDNNNE